MKRACSVMCVLINNSLLSNYTFTSKVSSLKCRNCFKSSFLILESANPTKTVTLNQERLVGISLYESLPLSQG